MVALGRARAAGLAGFSTVVVRSGLGWVVIRSGGVWPGSVDRGVEGGPGWFPGPVLGHV